MGKKCWRNQRKHVPALAPGVENREDARCPYFVSTPWPFPRVLLRIPFSKETSKAPPRACRYLWILLGISRTVILPGVSRAGTPRPSPAMCAPYCRAPQRGPMKTCPTRLHPAQADRSRAPDASRSVYKLGPMNWPRSAWNPEFQIVLGFKLYGLGFKQ